VHLLHPGALYERCLLRPVLLELRILRMGFPESLAFKLETAINSSKQRWDITSRRRHGSWLLCLLLSLLLLLLLVLLLLLLLLV
jgi:hypothetical protein